MATLNLKFNELDSSVLFLFINHDNTEYFSYPIGLPDNPLRKAIWEILMKFSCTFGHDRLKHVSH